MATSHDPHVEELAANLTAFQRDLLAAIPNADHHDNEPIPYGLSVLDELESWYGEELNHSRMYMNLDDLETLGLVEKVEINDRSKGLQLTDGGKDVLGALAEWHSRE